MSIAEELTAALKVEGLPIDGVALSDSDPKEEWRVIWLSPPAPEHEAAAMAVIADFDPEAAQARAAALKTLRDTDAKMARAVEDLIGLLDASGAVKLADYPKAVRDLIAARKAARTVIAAASD